MSILDSPPQIRYLWVFQIHRHRFSSMGLNQFSPLQIRHLWAFQSHQHRFSSVSICFGYLTTIDWISMGISIFTTIDQTSTGISVSPPQIFIYRHFNYFTTIDLHLWALISYHHHRSNIYGHFRFTTIDFHLWALISFHHRRSDIYRHFSITTIDYHLWASISFHHHRSNIYRPRSALTTIDQTSMGISVSPPQIKHLWEFQFHHHRLTSMGIFVVSPPQVFTYWPSSLTFRVRFLVWLPEPFFSQFSIDYYPKSAILHL